MSAGSLSVFSWKTNEDRSAATSSGVYAASVFSRMSSVRMSSEVELICPGVQLLTGGQR